MNKKGFTLIELLTVIVVLAVIILIAMPVISNIIEDSRKNTFKISLESLIKVAKNNYNGSARIGEVTYTLSENTLICTSGCQEGNIEIDYSGNLKEAKGTITINGDNINMEISNALYKGVYEQLEDPDKGKIENVKVEKINES